MKKLICLAFVALAACSGIDDAPTPVQTPPQTNGNIYGKWYYKDSVVAGNIFPYDDHEPCGKDYIEFYDVNMVKSVDVWDCVEEIDFVGTFTKNGNQLTIGDGSENPQLKLWNFLPRC